VKQALVTKITSGEEFKDILERDSSAKLVVLQVGFTFCRPCLAFEPKYERLARQYGDAARLVKVNGNENGNTIELCRDQLKVERTPTFIFFRDGQEIHRHTGINLDVFHEAMAEAGLELGPTEDN
jgi:thioredoxin 1